MLFLVPLLIALAAGLASVWLGRRILALLESASPEAGFGPAAGLIRWQKRASLVCAAAILLTLLTGLWVDGARIASETNVRHGVLYIDPLDGEAGWSASARGLMEAVLLEAGMVGLRVDVFPHTHLYLLAPDGAVIFHHEFEQRAGLVRFWFEPQPAGVTLGFATRHTAQRWWVPRGGAGWEAALRLEGEPSGEFLPLVPLHQLGEAQLLPVAATDGWQLLGYTTWSLTAWGWRGSLQSQLQLGRAGR